MVNLRVRKPLLCAKILHLHHPQTHPQSPRPNHRRSRQQPTMFVLVKMIPIGTFSTIEEFERTANGSPKRRLIHDAKKLEMMVPTMAYGLMTLANRHVATALK